MLNYHETSAWRARLEYLLYCHPMMVKRLFLKNRKALYKDLYESTDRALRHRQRLEEKGNLLPGEIDEIVTNMVAPTDVEPQDPLPEDLEMRIRNWAENPPEEKQSKPHKQHFRSR